MPDLLEVAVRPRATCSIAGARLVQRVSPAREQKQGYKVLFQFQ